MLKISNIVIIFSAKIFDDTYLLEHNRVSRRSVDPHAAAHAEVSDHPAVSWAEQQRVLSRQKRQLWRLPPPTLPPPEHYENDLNLNDERYVGSASYPYDDVHGLGSVRLSPCMSTSL